VLRAARGVAHFYYSLNTWFSITVNLCSTGTTSSSLASEKMGFLQDWFNREAKKSQEKPEDRKQVFDDMLESHTKRMQDE